MKTSKLSMLTSRPVVCSIAPCPPLSRLPSFVAKRHHRDRKGPKPPKDPPPQHINWKLSFDKKFPRFRSAKKMYDSKMTGRIMQLKPLASDVQRDSASQGSRTLEAEPQWQQENADAIMDPKAAKRQKQLEVASSFEKPQILPRTPAVRVLSQKVAASHWDDALDLDIDVIAEDDCYMFVNKPAGIPSHGTENEDDILAAAIKRRPPIGSRRHYSEENEGQLLSPRMKTFHEMFMEHWWTANPFVRFQPGLMHRLDKDVSGVMVYAKKWCAQRHFRKLQNDNNSEYVGGCGVKKCYVAICKGIPLKNEGVIEGIHNKDCRNIKKYFIYKKGASGNHILRNGKVARSEYKVLDVAEHGVFGQVSLVAFTISTGRRHQIRATAFRLGTPIVGDVLYGGPKYGRLLLHSVFVGFDGVVDSGMLYGVSSMPEWQHLRHNMYTSRSHYYLKEYINGVLMKVPRPSKKARLIEYSLKKERMEMKRESLTNKPLLIPFTAKKEAAAERRALEAGVYSTGASGVRKAISSSDKRTQSASLSELVNVNDSANAVDGVDSIVAAAIGSSDASLLDSAMINELAPPTIARVLDDRKQIYRMLRNTSAKNDFYSDSELLAAEEMRKGPLKIKVKGESREAEMDERQRERRQRKSLEKLERGGGTQSGGGTQFELLDDFVSDSIDTRGKRKVEAKKQKSSKIKIEKGSLLSGAVSESYHIEW